MLDMGALGFLSLQDQLLEKGKGQTHTSSHLSLSDTIRNPSLSSHMWTELAYQLIVVGPSSSTTFQFRSSLSLLPADGIR